MKTDLPLTKDKKLTVLCRVEPGCLGPDGQDHIKDFCTFTQKEVESIYAKFIHWNIVPRDDKSLPEMQYQIGSKQLTQERAAKYLKLFGKDLEQLEEKLHETIAHLINRYLKS